MTIEPGIRVGKWTVLRPTVSATGKKQWVCRCDCDGGKEIPVSAYALKAGLTKSCGCSRLEAKNRLTHGETSRWEFTPEYRCWTGMKARCSNPNKSNYRFYGGRGILVSDRWINSYETFLSDMGRMPSPKHTLDRIDPDGNYEPGNVRWATWSEQQRNRGNNRVITLLGKTQCLAAWAEELGLNYRTLTSRIRSGWSYERVLTQPLRVRGGV
jgi:hypothetical protein